MDKKAWELDELELRIASARDALPPNVTGLLPSGIAELVEVIAKEGAISPFMILGPLLTTAAFLTGFKSTAQAGPFHTLEVKIKYWSVVVMFSGYRKSSGHESLEKAILMAAQMVKCIPEFPEDGLRWFYESVSPPFWLRFILCTQF